MRYGYKSDDNCTHNYNSYNFNCTSTQTTSLTTIHQQQQQQQQQLQLCHNCNYNYNFSPNYTTTKLQLQLHYSYSYHYNHFTLRVLLTTGKYCQSRYSRSSLWNIHFHGLPLRQRVPGKSHVKTKKTGHLLMEQWRSTPAAARLVGKSGQTMSHRLSQHCRLPRFQCTWDGLDGYFEPNSFVLFGHKTTSKCTPLASRENDIFASKVANCMKAGATFLLVLADFQRQIGFVSRIMESNRVKGNLLNYMIYNKSWNISFLCYAMIFKSPCMIFQSPWIPTFNPNPRHFRGAIQGHSPRWHKPAQTDQRSRPHFFERKTWKTWETLETPWTKSLVCWWKRIAKLNGYWFEGWWQNQIPRGFRRNYF